MLTFDEQIGIAIGSMGMSLDSFLMLTPDQFEIAYNNWLELKVSERKASDLQAWQIARWQVWRTLCPPEKKEISPLDLIMLPGDETVIKEQNKKTQSTRERFEELGEKWK
jgi:hypothetical protein